MVLYEVGATVDMLTDTGAVKGAPENQSDEAIVCKIQTLFTYYSIFIITNTS